MEDKTNYVINFLRGIKLNKYFIDSSGKALLEDLTTTELAVINGVISFLESEKISSLNTITDLLEVNEEAIIRKLYANISRLNEVVLENILSSERFISGFLGEGFRLKKTPEGLWNLELDNLIVRKTFQVFEIIVQKITHQGGMVIRSAAGGTITEVQDAGDTWKCLHDGVDDFMVDDLVLC